MLDLVKQHATRVAHKDSQDNYDVYEANQADVERSICLCLLRLSVLTKRWSLTRLLGDAGSSDDDLELMSEAVTSYLTAELNARQIVNDPPTNPDDDGKVVEVPKIWSSDDDKVHAVVADSVSEGLDFILGMTSWRLWELIQDIDKGEANYDNDDFEKHVLLRMRRRLQNLVHLCYNQFLAPDDMDSYSAAQQKFAVAVQEHALRISGDVRSLFPRKWLKAKDPFLSACALVDDSTMAGAGIRFTRSQEFRVGFATEVELVLNEALRWH